MLFEDHHGEIKYLWDTHDGFYIFVYNYNDISVKAKFGWGTPRVSLIRQDKNGRAYFNKSNYRVYIDELEKYTL